MDSKKSEVQPVSSNSYFLFMQRVVDDLKLLKYQHAYIIEDHIETENYYILTKHASQSLQINHLPITSKQLVMCVMVDDGSFLYYKLNKNTL
jgi:hypothetical protein